MASIRKRSWGAVAGAKEAWVCDYVDQHGKRRLKTFRTRKEADAWLVQARHEVAAGTHTADSASVTIAEAAGLWLERCEAHSLEQGTIRSYRNNVRHHVLPLLGGERLARLTTPRVQRLVDDLLSGGRSVDKTKQVLWTLKAVLSEAQRRGLLAQNAALPVKLRHGARHKERVVIPSKPHIQALINAATARWRPLLITAAFTGLRVSELRALRWTEVDLKASVLTVNRRADRFREIGSPKSAAARRDVPLMPIVISTLREWRLACPPNDPDLVFPTRGGRVLAHSSLIQNAFMTIQQRAALTDARGGPLYHFHLLRHFACSLFIEAGFSPKRMQAIMGHSSITMTFDLYGHLFPAPEDEAQRLLAAQRTVLGIGQ